MRRPSTRRGTVAAVVATVAIVIVLGFLAVYFLLFPTSSPKPFALGAVTQTSPATAGSSSGATGQTTALAGRFTVAGGSQAGYRVREKLAFLPAQSDAVGRTSQITGTATLADSGQAANVTAASFDIAVNTLKSDRSMRDERIHEIGLESARYPTATFVLTMPIAIPARSLNGQVGRTSATGLLTLHGTTRRVTIPLEVTVSGGTLQAAGALSFPWGRFNMTAPSVGGFVNVTETATMEFDLRLQRG